MSIAEGVTNPYIELAVEFKLTNGQVKMIRQARPRSRSPNSQRSPWHWLKIPSFCREGTPPRRRVCR